MARLHTTGAEPRKVEADGYTLTGTVNIDTTNPRLGLGAAFSVAAASSFAAFTFTGAVSTAYFVRAYVRISANPTLQTGLLNFSTAVPANLGEVYLETNGTLTLRLAGGTALATSAALVSGQYYMIELQANYPASGAATITMQVNGVVVGSGTGSATLPARYVIGNFTANAPGATVLFDDVALNDSTGGNQTSYPGEGKIVLLLPVSDSARGNWTAGTAGTTNLWDAVNNTPPVGVTTASGTTTSQVEDAVSAANDNYDAVTETYAAKGVGPNDTITLTQALARMGANTASAKACNVGATANPADAAVAVPSTSGAAAVGTDPTGWATLRGNVTYAPAVTRSTGATVRAGRNISGNFTYNTDLMGLTVEYVPARGQSVRRSSPAQVTVPITGGTF